jgi:hypothetical protein
MAGEAVGMLVQCTAAAGSLREISAPAQRGETPLTENPKND